MDSSNNWQNKRVFSKKDHSGNVGNKGLRREEENKFSKKKLLPVGIEPGTLGLLHSYAFLTELTWQVLREGYSTLLLLVHQLTFGLR